ncbi:MAG TPA: porin, partial [Thermoanaerobaculia bacterium]|nr:porin [Thermoanaerobaculia bacterium]
RETGLFYHGEFGEFVSGYLSFTNSTASNVVSDTNDTLFTAARIDIKPIKGLLVGVSGGTGAVTGAHLTRDRIAAHVRYDGPESTPFGFRAEYLRATDGQAGKDDLRQDGFYVSGLYTLGGHYQLGVRYDELNTNKDVDGAKIKTFTAGFHYLVKAYAQNSTTSRNVNIKLDYYHVKQEGRKINNNLEESYGQFVLGAQVAF